MAKFRSKGTVTLGGQEVSDGATVDAHVVSADEKSLQVPAGGAGGVDWLYTGDALVTLPDKSQHIVRAAQFTAQFEPSRREEREGASRAKEGAKK